MTLATIGTFLLSNWYWILLGYFAIGLVCKLLNLTGIIFKIIFFPFWLLGKLLKPCFRAIRNARAERKNTNHKD